LKENLSLWKEEEGDQNDVEDLWNFWIILKFKKYNNSENLVKNNVFWFY
jgi:hypothetical protein